MIARELRRSLTVGPRYSIAKIAFDLGLWFGLILAADWVGHPVGVLVAALLIGWFPMHDVLVHGHEATHGGASRDGRVNALVLWFAHGLFGLSGRAYRAFHMDHHRSAHTPQDSELLLYGPNPRGVDYLSSAWRSLWVINGYQGQTKVRRREVFADLLGAVVLHAAILAVAGPYFWLCYFLLPVSSSFVAAVVLRAITEHHGAPVGDAWQHTRATAAHPVLRFLWSNVDHHLEHHLAPEVPFHRLPAMRRALVQQRHAHDVTLDEGLVETALMLLLDPEHFGECAPLASRHSFGHRMKVWWMRDILRGEASRQHLLSLYFHGEAYESLHPLGVWFDKLAPRWSRKLRSQFDDENRHAAIFQGLLASEGVLPTPIEGKEDVGWYLLHHVVPQVCAAAGRPGLFSDEEAASYCGFLHALERRSIGDLWALREAAEAEGFPAIAEAARGILQDERVHALWTWRAMCVLAGSPEDAQRIFKPIRAGERRGTHQVLQHLIGVFEAKGARPSGAWLRWRLMAIAARLQAAVPLLPELSYRIASPKEASHAA